MFKKILKSILVLAIVLATAGTATRAWFTSNISAAENEITTGTLRAALGSTRDTTGAGTGYRVVYDDNGTMVQDASFPVLENMQPSTYGQTAYEKSIYVVVYNRGTLAFNYRTAVAGDWDDTSLDEHLMKVRHIHRYATNNWEGEWGPYNIKTWLDSNGYSWQSGVAADTWNYNPGYEGIWNDSQSVDAKKYQIYKVTVGLDSGADNTYQGRTFNYAMYVETKQLNAPWNWPY